MTQYQGSPGDQYAQQFATPPKTSGMAITAFVLSVIFFCPVTTILGPILGLFAFVSIGGDPTKKGKGLAISAIVLGLLFTGGQAWVWKKVYDLGYGWYVFVMKGPEPALNSAFTGDIAGFKLNFVGDGAAAPDAEAVAFVEQLRTRYGEFSACNFDTQSGQQPKSQPGNPKVPFPYILAFTNGQVNAEAELVFADTNTGDFLTKLGYIVVFDPDLGDLAYPASAADKMKNPPGN